MHDTSRRTDSIRPSKELQLVSNTFQNQPTQISRLVLSISRLVKLSAEKLVDCTVYSVDCPSLCPKISRLHCSSVDWPILTTCTMPYQSTGLNHQSTNLLPKTCIALIP